MLRHALAVAAVLSGALCGVDASAQAAPAQTPFIVIDQFGYQPQASKIAVVRDPVIGFDNQTHFTPGKVYQVVQAGTGKVVFNGRLTVWHDGAVDPSSGDHAWHFDFSAVSKPGRYVIRDRKRKYQSAPFSIADNVYKPVLVQAMRMLFYQRAGFTKAARFAGAGWADGASHLGPGQDTEARLYRAKDDPATARDLHGGWYDAGDFNRYTRWGGDYVVGLLHAYNQNPAAFTDDFGIPESGNGIPDLLDEVKWELEWLERMQNADGSLLSVIGLASGSPPSTATGASFYGPATTSATYGGAEAFAYAAKTYAQFPALRPFAWELQARALRAWTWAQANPRVLFYNNDPRDHSQGLAAGQQEVDDYGRQMGALAAAVYLFNLTAEPVYRDYVDAHYRESRIFVERYTSVYDYPHITPLLDYSRMPTATPSVAAAIQQQFITGFEKVGWQQLGNDPYQAWLPDYGWGSNGIKSNAGSIFAELAAYGASGHSTADAMTAAEDYVHYLHGVNPLGKVYLSHMGMFGASNSVDRFFHTWYAHGSPVWGSVRESTVGPPAGYLVGGANRHYDWAPGCPRIAPRCGIAPPSPPVGQPPQKSYADFNDSWPIDSWEVTEPSVSYQTAYIRLLARFVH